MPFSFFEYIIYEECRANFLPSKLHQRTLGTRYSLKRKAIVLKAIAAVDRYQDIHISDVHLLSTSWNDATHQTVMNCFRKAVSLPSQIILRRRWRRKTSIYWRLGVVSQCETRAHHQITWSVKPSTVSNGNVIIRANLQLVGRKEEEEYDEEESSASALSCDETVSCLDIVK